MLMENGKRRKKWQIFVCLQARQSSLRRITSSHAVLDYNMVDPSRLIFLKT